MAFGLPAFFGSKASTRVPLGVDVTTITDLSGSMGRYAQFITSPLLYEALETALTAENIGTAAGQTNRYSFCVGGGTLALNLSFIPPNYDDRNGIERAVGLNGVRERWAPGADVLAQTVGYPKYVASGGGNENMAGSTNTVSNEMPTFPSPSVNARDYILSNERIIISGSDEQSGQGSTTFDQTPAYSYRYVGIHDVVLNVRENITLPPKPAGELVGFVYTTASQGVAIYIDGSTINYRTEMPTNVFRAAPTPGIAQTQVCIDQCKITNGALYRIRNFNTASQYALLGESLGSVLGKYLYSIS